MSKLIIHSDDLGLDRFVNQAICDAYDQGLLTSASLLANGPAFDDAVALVKERPGLGIGVHLNIVRGAPLSDPKRVPSILGTSGGFLNSLTSLKLRSLRGSIVLDHVLREYELQVARVVAAGIKPTHLDSEKHSHLVIQEASNVLCDLADAFEIKCVRRINEGQVLHALAQRGKRVRVGFRRSVMRHVIDWHNFRRSDSLERLVHVDGFFGIATSGKIDSLDASFVEELFYLDEFQTIEWMLHLGHKGGYAEELALKGFGSFFLANECHRELAFLTSPAVSSVIREHKAALVHYGSL